MRDVREEEWKDFLLGLQEKLNVTQFELLRMAGLKPVFQVSEWISGNRPVPKNGRERFVNLALSNRFEIENIVDFGRFVRNGLKVDGIWFSENALLNRECLSEYRFVERGGGLMINTSSLFPRQHKGKEIQFMEDGTNIMVFYREKRSTRPRPLVLPRHLEMTEDFMVGLGIYMAEGSRNRHPKVTNSEPAVIRQAIKFFSILGTKPECLKAWIQLHERSPKTESCVKGFWSDATGLNEKNITGVRIKKSCGSAPVEENGVLHLEAGFIILQILIEQLLCHLPGILEASTNEQILCFLRGAFAGEGYAGLSRTGSLNEISYTSTKIEEIETIKILLSRVGVESTYNLKCYELSAFGFRNLEKLVEYDIFKYHNFRRSRANNGLEHLKKNHIPGLNKDKILNLLREGALSTIEVKNKTGMSYENTRKHLRELEKAGVIKTSRKRGPIQSEWCF